MKLETLTKANEIDSKLNFISEQLIYLQKNVINLENIESWISKDIASKIKEYVEDILKTHYEKLKIDFENLK